MVVTVILFTYNHEKFIGHALNGVLMQRTNFDYEVYVLDDSSTDGTSRIVIDYQTRNPGVIHLRIAKENRNDNAQLMKTLESMSSPYLALLDGDDFWTSPDKLQRQVDFLNRHPECSVCFHNVRAFYEDGSKPSYYFNPADQSEISTLDHILQWNFVGGCSAVFRKVSIERLPHWFASVLWTDWALYILASHHGNIGYINEVMGAYRIHHEGFWSGKTEIEQIGGTLQFYQSLMVNLQCDCVHKIKPIFEKQLADLAAAKKKAKEAPEC